MTLESKPIIAHANRLVLLIALTLLAYANSFDGVFVFDDYSNIIESETIRSVWPPTWNQGQRPWFYLSLAMNYAIHELDPFGYHLFNFAIHLGAGLTLFGLVRRTLALPNVAEHYRARADSIALIVAAIWLVHPLNTSAVTYIVQRCESMMGLCFLALLYFSLRGATASRGWPWYTLAAVAFYAGIGSKEVMAVSPLVLLLFDRIFLAGSWRELVRRRWGLYLVIALPFLWFMPSVFRSFTSTSGTSTAGFAYKGVTPWEYALTQPGVILHYLRLSIWPHPLCLDYGWPVARTWQQIVPSAIMIGTLLGASLRALVKRPMIGFLGVSFFIILAPTSSIMPIKDLAFEHRMYLPLVCVILLAVLAFSAVSQKTEKMFRFSGPFCQFSNPLLVATCIAALCWTTWHRNRDYASGERMWLSVLEIAPNNPRAHFCWSTELAKQGRILEAQAAIKRALELDPQYAEAMYVLGKCHLELHQLEEAENQFAKSLQLFPTNGRLLTDYGWLHFSHGGYERAEELLRAAIKHKPLPAEPHFTLARLLLKRLPNDEQSALEHLQRSHAINPKDISVCVELASLLVTAQDKTIRDGQRAISLLSEHANNQSDNAEFGHCLAAAYAEIGDFDTAKQIAELSIELAEKQGNHSLAEKIRLRLQSYRKGQNFPTNPAG